MIIDSVFRYFLLPSSVHFGVSVAPCGSSSSSLSVHLLFAAKEMHNVTQLEAFTLLQVLLVKNT